MRKHLRRPGVGAALAGILWALFIWSPRASSSQNSSEKGSFAVYFMEERVGYEEFLWEEGPFGYTLTVRGRMTKPVAVGIEELVIQVDSHFIPLRYAFRGDVSRVTQEITATFSEGTALLTRRVAGQEQTETQEVRRDAVLLPNPVFAPYMVVTKRFGCALEEKTDLAAYLIPQTEIPATVEPFPDTPCRMRLLLGSTEVILATDEQGSLLGLEIPSQSLRVVRTR